MGWGLQIYTQITCSKFSNLSLFLTKTRKILPQGSLIYVFPVLRIFRKSYNLPQLIFKLAYEVKISHHHTIMKIISKLLVYIDFSQRFRKHSLASAELSKSSVNFRFLLLNICRQILVKHPKIKVFRKEIAKISLKYWNNSDKQDKFCIKIVIFHWIFCENVWNRVWCELHIATPLKGIPWFPYFHLEKFLLTILIYVHYSEYLFPFTLRTECILLQSISRLSQ